MAIISQGYGFSITGVSCEPVTSRQLLDSIEDCKKGPAPIARRSQAPSHTVTIEWKMVPPSALPDMFDFTVHRSGSPDFRNVSDLELMADGVQGILEFTDYDLNLDNWYRQVYYRITATLREDSRIQLVSPVIRAGAYDSERELIIQEIRRLNVFLLEEFTGTVCAIFLKKTFGMKCHTCWDATMSRLRTDQCEDCYRTRILGGYYQPLLRKIQFGPPPKPVNIDEHGKEHRTFSTAIAPHDPILTPGDIIYDLTTREAWDVASLNPSTTKLGAIGHQNPVLYRLDRDDVENQVPASVDITELCSLEFEGVLGR